MSYILLKYLHVSCAALSYTLFFLRGLWMLRESPVMKQRWVKIVPHVIDTMLLVSAVALAYTIGQYPLADGWLTAKIAALLLYIGLGFVALKYGRGRVAKISAWITAQLVFAYIALVAISHSAMPFTP